jgi:hypothetical protein
VRNLAAFFCRLTCPSPAWQAPPDPLLSIDGRFRADSRASKLNLGIGVLRKTDASPHEFATVLKAAKVSNVSPGRLSIFCRPPQTPACSSTAFPQLHSLRADQRSLWPPHRSYHDDDHHCEGTCSKCAVRPAPGSGSDLWRRGTLPNSQDVPVATFYPSPAGDQNFLKLSYGLVFGPGEQDPRITAVQTGQSHAGPPPNPTHLI